MKRFDEAPVSVLYIGGTGTISASCVRLSVESGMQVSVLNRGNNSAARDIPQEVELLTGDVNDDASLRAAIGDRQFDSVVNFLSYDEDDVRRMVALFSGRTKQYVHISSGSIYAKPVKKWPIDESSPTSLNPVLEYASAKYRAEQALFAALADGFPVTIVRPAHTYDDANPPLPGAWTMVERLVQGKEIPVHGDGTSLWTLTHSEDFAQGFVGLLGNPRTIGEVFNITGEDVYTWDEIYTVVAEAFGVEAKLVHIASELFPVVAPDWFWSGEVLGDIGHSAVFDITKLRSFVPGYAPKLTFHRAVRRMAEWRAAHPDTTRADDATDAVLDRLVDAYHAGRDAFAERAPQTAGAQA